MLKSSYTCCLLVSEENDTAIEIEARFFLQSSRLRYVKPGEKNYDNLRPVNGGVYIL